MHWLFTPAAGILFSSTALALVAAGMIWNRRSVPGGALLFLLMLGVAEYTLASGLEAASVTLFWKTLWAKLQYVGSGAVSTLLLLFATQYTGHDSWLRGWRRYAVWILPIANVAAVSTNELHHWIWTGFLPGAAGTNLLVYIHGPGFYVAVGALYAYLGIACSLLVGAAVRPVIVRRRQSVTVLLGTAFPLAAGCLYIAGITPLAGLDLIPIACLLSAAVLIASVGAFRVFDLLPIARDALVEEMSDAVLVVDEERRVIDLNPAAGRLLGLDSAASPRTWFRRGRKSRPAAAKTSEDTPSWRFAPNLLSSLTSESPPCSTETAGPPASSWCCATSPRGTPRRRTCRAPIGGSSPTSRGSRHCRQSSESKRFGTH